MSPTAGLPWHHPAVILGVLFLVLSLATIAHEEHLQAVGALRDEGPIRLIMSISGSAFWAWCTVKMIGEPHAFFDSKAPLSAERGRKREKFLARLGYSLQLLSISGVLALLWHRTQ